jgi:ATP-binding cassette subfamily F protein uup
MVNLLNCDNISKSHGLRPLFRGISFGIGEGERLGLIGPNVVGEIHAAAHPRRRGGA